MRRKRISFWVKWFPSRSIEHQNFASDPFPPTPCLSALLSLERLIAVRKVSDWELDGAPATAPQPTVLLDKVISCVIVSSDVTIVTIKVSS